MTIPSAGRESQTPLTNLPENTLTIMNLAQIKLPSRPLSLKRGVISVPAAYYFSIPVLLVILAVMLVAEGPGILRDYQISKDPLEIESGDINGSCKTRKAIFTTCEADLSYEQAGVSYTKEVEVMFVDFHSGDYETGLVISAKNPELATISLGLDMLWNRIITLGVFVALLGFGSLAMLFTLIRVLRARLQLRHPAPLTVIPVALTAVAEKRSRLFVTYADTVRDAKTKRQSFTHLERGRIPVVVGHTGKHDIALAVWHGNTALPVLLDDQLERIDLSNEERAQALASIAPMVASQVQEASPTAGAAIKKQPGLLRRLGTFAAIVAVIIVAAFGYWLWYVTAAPSQFNSPGMDLNNMMPAAVNEWGCARLQERFADGPAPFGCTAADYRSWK
ncbi:conserved membrane hypothetical protein [Agrobacterium tomkonis CFBP 6623]|uniref:Transmembrane protein n=2 Tax=Agrobacterium TaxID=357 RepID=A0A1S7RZE7_9HYPH|nr:conserved membrane hypothetical protein [Agrobacterium tomkonis CFBP 6623]